MATLFFSYSHKDEGLRDQLETQLAMLKRQGVIETWHDRRIVVGEDLHNKISTHIAEDDIFLLLISPDFLASEYCYDVEMMQIIERHRSGNAIVIPVILRACDWHGAPFGRLLATPPDGRPITQWPDRDQAFLEVAKAIRAAVEKLGAPTSRPATAVSTKRAAKAAPIPTIVPRSSNLAVAKRHTDRDRDAYLSAAFDYLAAFFENSIAELKDRNPDIDGSFQRIDANRFFATAYRDGRAISRSTVFLGSSFGRSINYSHGQTMESNSLNESLSVDADDQALFLRPLGMAFGRRAKEEKLTFEGAAELYWDMFISPLQQR